VQLFEDVAVLRRFAKLVKDAREQLEAWKESQVVKEFTGTEKCEK
jgi:hypothetical protein